MEAKINALPHTHFQKLEFFILQNIFFCHPLSLFPPGPYFFTSLNHVCKVSTIESEAQMPCTHLQNK